eukprot:CAMPEP_0183503280 /NCGR_PEP_ID=MMETSP0371-20130417/5000_1 /TAXON_ID=268820 /ORGANISM="Peridinium aciculiferum, Strain PAER-2" /LENGTH=37 /DNA_ID= /DNA_START= /DNA_END= /DNA_ORIENTATION=
MSCKRLRLPARLKATNKTPLANSWLAHMQNTSTEDVS